MGAIVLGYAHDPEGRAALDRAVEEAQLRSARVVIVNLQRGGRSPDRDAAEDPEPGLAKIGHELDVAGVEHEIRALQRGREPADDLVKVAAEVNADFIVVGLRRRTPVGKLKLGATLQRVLLEAACPVLTVKAEEKPH